MPSPSTAKYPRVSPEDVVRLTVVATFPTIHDVCEAVSDTTRYGLNPAAMDSWIKPW